MRSLLTVASAGKVSCPCAGECVKSVVCEVSCDCQRNSCLCELQRVLLYRIVVAEICLNPHRQTAECDLIVSYLRECLVRKTEAEAVAGKAEPVSDFIEVKRKLAIGKRELSFMRHIGSIRVQCLTRYIFQIYILSGRCHCGS